MKTSKSKKTYIQNIINEIHKQFFTYLRWLLRSESPQFSRFLSDSIHPHNKPIQTPQTSTRICIQHSENFILNENQRNVKHLTTSNNFKYHRFDNTRKYFLSNFAQNNRICVFICLDIRSIVRDSIHKFKSILSIFHE